MSKTPHQLRSRLWFNDPQEPGMTALYLERYLNYGLTREDEELESDRPIIDIAHLAPGIRFLYPNLLSHGYSS